MAERSGLPAYTLDDAKRLAGEVEMLRRVGALIARLEVDEAELFRDLVAVVRSRFRADRVTLILAEPESSELLVIDGDRLGAGGQLPVARVRAEDSPFAQVVRGKRSLLVSNRSDLDPLQPIARYLKEEGSKSAIAVPLIAGRAAIGALVLSGTVALAYQTDDVSTLELLGTLMGTVVENVRLFARVSNARRETQAVFDHFDEPIAVVDPRGRVIRVNRAMRDLVGGDYTDILGRSCTDVLAQTELRGGTCAHEPVIRTGKASVREIALENGTVLEVRIAPLETRDGKVEKVVHVVRNLTRDRAAVTEALRLRAALDEVSDGVLFVGTDGVIRAANVAMARLLDVLIGELIGKTLAEFLGGLGEPEAAAKLSALDAGGEPPSWDGTLADVGGTAIDYTVRPLEADDRLDGLIVVFRPASSEPVQSELA
ncbi:MAG: PAS domain-containing protein [Deltaproteobacteria bacterium]|nr:PAS domain-containing protein [Deltaproteobacteria bacterium]